MAEIINIDTFSFAKPEVGDHMRLYVFGEDGMHGGGQWFCRADLIKYPDEEIDIPSALAATLQAWAKGASEIRITNGGDELLFRMTRVDDEMCVAYPQGEGILTFFGSLK